MATSSSNVVLYETDGAVATITMNRPEVANAQDTALIDQLDAAFDRADADDAIRVVILTGAGKHFSSGHDLKAIVGDGEKDDVGPDAREPRRQVLPREDHVLRPLPAHPRFPQTHHRRRPGELRRRRPDAGGHVRPHRRRRRCPILQSGAASLRRRGRAADRALGAGHPQGEGIPPHGRHHRRPGSLASGPGQPGGAPGRTRRREPENWPTGSPSFPR